MGRGGDVPAVPRRGSHQAARSQAGARGRGGGRRCRSGAQVRRWELTLCDAPRGRRIAPGSLRGEAPRAEHGKWGRSGAGPGPGGGGGGGGGRGQGGGSAGGGGAGDGRDTWRWQRRWRWRRGGVESEVRGRTCGRLRVSVHRHTRAVPSGACFRACFVNRRRPGRALPAWGGRGAEPQPEAPT